MSSPWSIGFTRTNLVGGSRRELVDLIIRLGRTMGSMTQDLSPKCKNKPCGTHGTEEVGPNRSQRKEMEVTTTVHRPTVVFEVRGLQNIRKKF